MRIRRAIPDDVGALVRIKNQRQLHSGREESAGGGFLLGTDEQTYLSYIHSSICLVAENQPGGVVGFGIIFPDPVLRESEIWKRRDAATWLVDLGKYENRKLCYFEQFAFLDGFKRATVLMSYHIVKLAFDLGHQTLFATTVTQPVRNLAAVPFILKLGGMMAGNIHETYPGFGEIHSDIYLLEAADFHRKSIEHPLYPFVTRNPVIFG